MVWELVDVEDNLANLHSNMLVLQEFSHGHKTKLSFANAKGIRGVHAPPTVITTPPLEDTTTIQARVGTMAPPFENVTTIKAPPLEDAATT